MDLLILLKPSKLYLTSILASALAGLLGIVLAGQSFLVGLVLVLIWLTALCWAMRAWVRAPTSLRLGKTSIDVESMGVSHSKAIARVMPFLICFPNTESSPSVLIWKDSMADKEWRQLRWWLKIHSV
jgi:hypothetical protein